MMKLFAPYIGLMGIDLSDEFDRWEGRLKRGIDFKDPSKYRKRMRYIQSVRKGKLKSKSRRELVRERS